MSTKYKLETPLTITELDKTILLEINKKIDKLSPSNRTFCLFIIDLIEHMLYDRKSNLECELAISLINAKLRAGYLYAKESRTQVGPPS